MHLEVKRFSPELRSDFFRLHSKKNGCGWCFCTAWWLQTWEGWSDRTAEENKCFRETLLDQGEYDGYLILNDDEVVGWCQVGLHERLEKLVKQFSLPTAESVWAITCFLIAPQYRRQGIATLLLNEIVRDLKARGAKSVLAFPKVGKDLGQLEMWNGPLALFLEVGFSIWKDNPMQPVVRLNFNE